MSRDVLSRYGEALPFVTKDGSTIRELLHPERHGVERQSLAEARVPVGARTILHRHHRSEELYHICAGEAVMTLGEAQFEVRAGDSVCIAPGTAHGLRNTGTEELVLLCCCTPAYDDDDTELLEALR